MITKNGSILWGKGRIGDKAIADSDMKTTQGENMGVVVDNYKSNITASSTSPIYYHVQIGSGTNEPQKTDYSMQEITTLQVQKGDTTVSYTPDGNVLFTRTFTNITNDTLTITELGIYLIVGGYADGYAYLIARKLVPTRTLTPNETATFSYVIEFN